MANTSKQLIDNALLEGFTPLSNIDRDTLDKLTRHASVETFAAGESLFERGDATQRTFYLLEGEIELSSPLFPTQKVCAKTDAGRYPLAHSFPRQFTAMTVSDARVLMFPLDISEIMQSSAGNAKPAASKLWEIRWLASPMLRRLTIEHKKSLLTSMEEIKVQAGQVVIHQDEPADSYYVLKKGRCSVSRKPAPGARDVKLAELSEGQGFGEEALITNVPRNASVTMLSDGTLLRLGKQAFIELMAKPLLHHLPFQHAIQLVEQGAVLVDVRTPEEFEIDGLIGSMNMPIPVLRLKANRLNRDRTYIVYSNTGQTSSVAVFLMLQQGLNACVLEGGLNNAPKYRMKRGGFADQAQEEQVAQGMPNNTVLPFPNNAAKMPAQGPSEVDWNHVSDDVLWRTTLGYRDDAGVEAAMTAQPSRNPQPAGDMTHQGFDEIRLFTTIDTGQNTGLVNDDAQQRGFSETGRSDNHRPPMRQMPSGQFGNPAAPRTTGYNQQASAWNNRSSRTLGQRIVMAFLIVVVLLGGWIGFSYFKNGKLPTNIQDASPMLMEQQRKLDAKVNRLLDAIETIPAMQGRIKDNKDMAPAATPGSLPPANDTNNGATPPSKAP
jgi:CRP-like cAMP-binding protein